MYIAKIDENNIVTQVLTASKSKVCNKNGTLSQEKAQSFAESINGVGTYILYDDQNMSGVYPSIGDEWDTAENHFHGPRPVDRNGNPCTSWTLDENCVWISPQNTIDTNNRGKLAWDEAEQRWYSHVAGQLETGNQWYWNTTTNAWVEITE